MDSNSEQNSNSSFRVRGDAYFTNSKGEIIHLGVTNGDVHIQPPEGRQEKERQPIVFTKPQARLFIQLTPDVLRDAGLMDGFMDSEFDEAEKALNCE